jgi:hypothetical protein
MSAPALRDERSRSCPSAITRCGAQRPVCGPNLRESHGIALLGRLPVKGLLGWLIARGYHMLQLPFHSRRTRVLADWTSAAIFKRDTAELSSIESPDTSNVPRQLAGEGTKP